MKKDNLKIGEVSNVIIDEGKLLRNAEEGLRDDEDAQPIFKWESVLGGIYPPTENYESPHPINMRNSWAGFIVNIILLMASAASLVGFFYIIIMSLIS